MPQNPIQPQALRILIVDDEVHIRTTLTICLEAAGHQIAEFSQPGPALESASTRVFDLLFLDLRLGTENGLDYIPRFLEASPWLKIIVITAYASIDTAVEAMRRGAADYLPKPFTPEQVEMLAAKIAELRALELQVQNLREALGGSDPQPLLASNNPRMRAAVEMARQFAASRSAVLLEGKTGTGKGLLAQAIHHWSPRRGMPFMALPTGGRAEGELAAELFGSAAGHLPAVPAGRIERCAGGTLYIEEIRTLPAGLQKRLLQLIQSGTYEREGEFAAISADVRIIAGTAGPLQFFVENAGFRQDLYYALTAKLVEIPALCERIEDLRPLTEHFLTFFARQSHKQITGFSEEALEYLEAYAWPGNIRELRNVVERAVILAHGPLIRLADFPPNMFVRPVSVAVGDLVPLESIEEAHIRGVLLTTKNLETAAQILGIDYATLWRRRKKYGL